MTLQFIYIFLSLNLVFFVSSHSVGFDSGNTDYIPHHTLYPPLIPENWPDLFKYWRLGGSTVVTDEFVRLTPSSPSRTGFIWNLQPVEIPSWEVVFEARAYGPGRFGADGFAFWYTRSMFTYWNLPAHHLFGGDAAFNGLAVVFDSYNNDATGPDNSITVIRNDGTRREWSLGKDLVEHALLSNGFEFRTQVGHSDAPPQPFTVRLVYMSPMKTLIIYTKTPNSEETEFGRVNVDLFTGGYFGFTAATGDISDVHEIVSIRVRALHDIDHPE